MKRWSITAALLVAVIGTTVGLSAPASAVPNNPSYVNYADPVSLATQLEHNVKNPVEATKLYRVKEGNTLSQIAHKFDLNWKKLYCANRGVIGKDPNMIASGIKLKIRESHHVWCPITVERPANVGGNSTVSVTAPVVPAQQNYVGGGSFQQCVIMAESGGDPTAYNSSSGASGLYGFLLSTWDSLGLGYPGGAYTAPVSVQNEGFAIEYARAGTAPWAPYDGC